MIGAIKKFENQPRRLFLRISILTCQETSNPFDETVPLNKFENDVVFYFTTFPCDEYKKTTCPRRSPQEGSGSTPSPWQRADNGSAQPL
jgi:hypothetical protein